MRRTPLSAPVLAAFFTVLLVVVACQTGPDTTPPAISGSSPANGAAGVASTQALTVDFSEAMNQASVTFTGNPAVALEAAVWLDANSARVTPVTGWEPGVQQVTVQGNDLAGNPLPAGAAISFTVQAPPDTTAPAAPSNVTATPADEGFLLSWDANTEPDLAGYFVFFGEDPEAPTGASYVEEPEHELAVSGLQNGTTYHYFVIAEDLSGNLSEPSATGTVVPADDVAPTLVSSTPADGSVDLGAVPLVRLTFSEAMNPASFTLDACEKTGLGSALPCQAPPEALAGATWAEGDTEVTFATPDSFEGGAFYTLFPIGTDVAGNPLSDSLSIAFSLAFIPDETPPSVTGYQVTLDSLEDVRRQIRFTFSEPMDPATIASAVLSSPPLGCIWTLAEEIATCRTSRLTEFTTYTISVSVTATDLAGNPLVAPYAAPALEIGDLRPYLVSVTPSGGGFFPVNVATHLVLTFSERIAIGSIQNQMFITAGGSIANWTESSEQDGKVWRYAPNPAWPAGATVAWQLPSVQDFTGNNSATSFSGSFNTQPVLGLSGQAADTPEREDATND